VIAALNNLEPSRSLTIGREITMPVVLDHELARGESLVELAERFYGDPLWADALMQFNEIEDPRRLPVGAMVRIPLASLRLVAPPARNPAPPVTPPRKKLPTTAAADTATATPDIAAPESLAEPPEEPLARFGIELRRARMAFADGDFESSRAMLQAIDEAVGRTGLDSEREELWRLLAFVHVAYDEIDAACASFGKLPRKAPVRTELDPDLISPKIRATLRSCRGDDPSTGASK